MTKKELEKIVLEERYDQVKAAITDVKREWTVDVAIGKNIITSFKTMAVTKEQALELANKLIKVTATKAASK